MLFYHNNRRKVKIKQEMMRETMEMETLCAQSVEDRTACGHRSRIDKFLCGEPICFDLRYVMDDLQLTADIVPAQHIASELGNSLSGHEATVEGLHCNMGSARQDVIEVECPPRG